MGCVQAPSFWICRRQLGGVLAHDLEQPVSPVGRLDDAGGDERVELLDRGVRPAHVEHRLGGEAAAEDREPTEQPLFREIEQLDAPVDRRAHRPVAHRGVPRSSRERVEARVEQPEQLPGRQRPKPRRGQLDRQRQALEPVADLAKLGSVGIDPCARGHRSGGEQPAGGVSVERLHVEDPFGG